MDGEGYIGLIKSRNLHQSRGFQYTPRVEITNTNLSLIKAVQTVIGGKILTTPRKLQRKEKYTLHLRVPEIRSILPQLSLIIKEFQRVSIMEAIDILSQNHPNVLSPTRECRLESLWTQMRAAQGKSGGRPPWRPRQ